MSNFKRSSFPLISSVVSRRTIAWSVLGWAGLGLGAAGLIAGCGGGAGGSGLVAPVPRIVTTVAGANAGFANSANVAIDSQVNALVCDFDNNRLARVTPSGVTTTFTQQANFARPFGITITPRGNIFVETDDDDLGVHSPDSGTLWRVNPATGAATVIARDLGRPRGLAALSETQIVLADVTNNDVRLINPISGAITPLAGLRGTAGFTNGTGAAARFSRPYGPAITAAGNILLADQTNNCIRMITPAGMVTTFAGDGTSGFRDGPKASARFSTPQDVDIDNRGNVYVADNGNFRIRRIGTDGQVATQAGSGVKGYSDGNATEARFYGMEGLAIDPGSESLLVADGNGGDGTSFNHLRRLNLP